MTTTVKVHVNGRYRANVVQKNIHGERVAEVVVEGNYEGSPNPSGEKTFNLHHPATATFDITESPVADGPA